MKSVTEKQTQLRDNRVTKRDVGFPCTLSTRTVCPCVCHVYVRGYVCPYECIFVSIHMFVRLRVKKRTGAWGAHAHIHMYLYFCMYASYKIVIYYMTYTATLIHTCKYMQICTDRQRQRQRQCGQTLNNDGLLSVWFGYEDCPAHVRDAYFLNR